jgi:transcriptional regulator GlxA family with amidase domain
MVNVTYGDSLELFRRLDDVIVADLSEYPQVRSAFEGILAEQGGATEGSAALTRALMTQCIVYLLRNLTDQSDGRLPWLPGLEDPNLSQAVDSIFKHPETPHTVDSLADQALMSRSVFAERFREAFGDTPINFVHNIRIRKAADLLRGRTGPTAEQIARQVGFSSRTHFSSAFKSQFGVSPAAFQKGQMVG